MTAKSTLAAAIAALLLSVAVADARAEGTYTSRGQRPVVAEGDEATDEGDKGRDDDKSDRKGEHKGPDYPNATRPEPAKAKPGKLQNKLVKLFDLYQDQKYPDVLARADEIIADPKASPWERAQAARVAAAAAAESTDSDFSKAIAYYERGVSENALSNDEHYGMLLQIADLNLRDEKYAETLAAVDRFLAETKSTDWKPYALKGNALYRMEKYADAVAALKQAIPAQGEADPAVLDLLIASYVDNDQAAAAIPVMEAFAAKRPDDKRIQLNLASVYSQADQPAKAAAVFERLRQGGKLTEEKDYIDGARLLANLDGRENDTIALLKEGLDKGVLKPSAAVYSLMGQSYFFTDRFAEAAEAYAKAAPLAKDGELYYNLASTYAQIERWAEVKAAARQALDKGMRTPGNAWILIAAAEDGLGNPAGRLAAYREAAKDPKTRDAANKMIKALGGK
jgi:tetratricopeptide (TPR) repeat protein